MLEYFRERKISGDWLYDILGLCMSDPNEAWKKKSPILLLSAFADVCNICKVLNIQSLLDKTLVIIRIV